jgi:hypothetical protein
MRAIDQGQNILLPQERKDARTHTHGKSAKNAIIPQPSSTSMERVACPLASSR